MCNISRHMVRIYHVDIYIYSLYRYVCIRIYMYTYTYIKIYRYRYIYIYRYRYRYVYIHIPLKPRCRIHIPDSFSSNMFLPISPGSSGPFLGTIYTEMESAFAFSSFSGPMSMRQISPAEMICLGRG